MGLLYRMCLPTRVSILFHQAKGITVVPCNRGVLSLSLSLRAADAVVDWSCGLCVLCGLLWVCTGSYPAAK